MQRESTMNMRKKKKSHSDEGDDLGSNLNIPDSGIAAENSYPTSQ